MTATDRETWVYRIADTYWQHADGEAALIALMSAKVPIDGSPETAEELYGMLGRYIDVHGHTQPREAARRARAATAAGERAT